MNQIFSFDNKGNSFRKIDGNRLIQRSKRYKNVKYLVRNKNDRFLISKFVYKLITVYN